MTNKLWLALIIVITSCSGGTGERNVANETPAEIAKRDLFMDVHNVKPGAVKFEDVSTAHEKDLAAEDQFNVHFLKYWVDELKGKIYCLVEAADSISIFNTHKKAHGLTPDRVAKVESGKEVPLTSKGSMFFDVHHVGPGKITSIEVAAAHDKDLAAQDKYGVNFVNYWVDEKDGIFMCIAEAPDSSAMVKTHRDAHGLIPDEVHLVRQGN